MKSSELQITTGRRTQFVAITPEISAAVAANNWEEGVLTVFVPHTTAGVTINENADPDVARDMEWYSDTFVPDSRRFRHREGNSAAHIKASLFGSSVQIIVHRGSLWLGTWQGIYFCEFDGPRQRQIYLAFIPSPP